MSISLRTNADVVALAAPLLGYAPTDSVIAYMLRTHPDGSTVVRVVFRLPLLATTEQAGRLARTLNLSAEDNHGAILIAICNQGDDAHAGALLDAVRNSLQTADIPVQRRLLTRTVTEPSYWIDVDTGDRWPTHPYTDSELAALVVAEGRRIARSCTEVAEEFSPIDPAPIRGIGKISWLPADDTVDNHARPSGERTPSADLSIRAALIIAYRAQRDRILRRRDRTRARSRPAMDASPGSCAGAHASKRSPSPRSATPFTATPCAPPSRSTSSKTPPAPRALPCPNWPRCSPKRSRPAPTPSASATSSPRYPPTRPSRPKPSLRSRVASAPTRGTTRLRFRYCPSAASPDVIQSTAWLPISHTTATSSAPMTPAAAHILAITAPYPPSHSLAAARAGAHDSTAASAKASKPRPARLAAQRPSPPRPGGRPRPTPTTATCTTHQSHTHHPNPLPFSSPHPKSLTTPKLAPIPTHQSPSPLPAPPHAPTSPEASGTLAQVCAILVAAALRASTTRPPPAAFPLGQGVACVDDLQTHEAVEHQVLQRHRQSGQASIDGPPVGWRRAGRVLLRRRHPSPTWLVVGDVDAVGEATGLDGAALHGGFADTETVARWFDDGVAPNGASGRAFGDTGVHGFDLVFAAPKSVSLLRALRGDDVTEKILLNAHNKGIQAAMAYLHEHAGYTRVHNPLPGKRTCSGCPAWWRSPTSMKPHAAVTHTCILT